MVNKINYENDVSLRIRKYINEEKNKKNILDVVLVCIGTDRMTGDSFGPLVGSKIKEKLEKYNISNINVYGTLNNNVCYTNIKETMELIKNRHQSSCVIAIDSALGEKEDIGKIIVNKEKIHIGKGLNKNKIELGDISIKAVVGKNCKLSNYNFYILQNTSLNEVIKLSNKVADGVIDAILNW
ncbi:MAG: spore protease YyaC [Clostridia bacterium]|nr:spore protease YyaC [Clostridia bacterium]